MLIIKLFELKIFFCLVLRDLPQYVYYSDHFDLKYFCVNLFNHNCYRKQKKIIIIIYVYNFK